MSQGTHMNWSPIAVIPTLEVTDIASAVEFYQTLGFSEQWRWPDEPAAVTHAAMAFGDVELMFALVSEDARIEVQTLYLCLDDVDGYHAHLSQQISETEIVAPENQSYGMRDFGLSDPWGHHLAFGESTVEETSLLGPLDEVILYVSNMDAQVRFYRDILGLRLLHPRDQGDYANEFWVEFDTGDCRLALHGGGGKSFGEDAPKFVFRVKDIAATRTALLARSVEAGEIRTPAPGVQVVDCRDPEGNRFSIESR